MDVVVLAFKVFDNNWGKELQTKELNEHQFVSFVKHRKERSTLRRKHFGEFFNKLNPLKSFKNQEGEFYTQHENPMNGVSFFPQTQQIF